MLNPIDKALQQAVPTIMVPAHQELCPMQDYGHRYLIAADGIWVEVLRPWLHATWPVALQSSVAMPYGTLSRKVKFSFQKLPIDLISRFCSEARAASPVEHGTWITWNSQSGEFRYRGLDITHASEDELNYIRPALDEDESLVLDLHSHGEGEAYFSPKDNRDDAGEVKIAGCIGLCDQSIQEQAYRLCLLGIFIPIPGPK